MTVKELSERLGLTIVTKSADIKKEVCGGFCSDLLSYVMGKAVEGDAWITIQGHSNIIAVAALKELACIIVANNIKIGTETIKTAEEQNIPVLSGMDKSFELAGKLYNLLR